MFDEKQQAILEGGFREELKGIVSEAISETSAPPAAAASKWTPSTILASLGGAALVVAGIATFGHLPKDIESLSAHVSIHDAQIITLMVGQGDIKEKIASLAATANDTNDRIRRMEAHEDTKTP